ncbi:MAG: haloacid dehalogenase-like hydrolase [Planctomycetes bacterium]|jgi:phosphoglycolate phosphatase-like HAD superfamily hydrolase|nr:haloacid dehalogenase-like hydrolase [Planctomycetota bacterium]
MRRLLVAAVLWAGCCGGVVAADEPLPSWNDGAAKQRIVSFVEAVTDESAGTFVPEAQRIATFDNDGCLWAEQPAYFQLLFILDRVKAMAPDHPEWKTTEPFKSVLADDMKGVMASGKEGLAKLAAATHTGMTSEEFADAAHDWLATAEHPTLGRPYTELVYQPQLELLDYLRANGFKTFIVSGGGIDFLRVFAEEVYGIPPEQVVGTSVAAAYEVRDGVPVIIKKPEGLFVDDKEGKPVGIYQHIGRRPILAVGNSDGDFQMLEYTTASRGQDDATPRLGVLIHHDDAEREFAYDRESHVGRLDRGLDEAAGRGWLVVSMKTDWARVFPKAAE